MPLALSIVIPAHNEASRIERGYARLKPVLETFDSTTVEVLIVDDGSTDATGRIAAATYEPLGYSRVVRQERNLGKGAAVRLGLTIATGQKIVVCDADMAINPVHLADVIAALDSAPLAFGSRANEGSIRYDSRIRTWSGAAFNRLVRREVHTSLRDTQCGFKGFQLAPARLLGSFGLVQGFAYDVEMLYLAGLLQLMVTPVAVTWNDVPGSSVRLFGDSRRMLSDIRSLRHTSYECPVIITATGVDVERLAAVARSTRVSGVVVAEGSDDALVVLPREGVVAGVELAKALKGSLNVATPEQFRGRTLRSV